MKYLTREFQNLLLVFVSYSLDNNEYRIVIIYNNNNIYFDVNNLIFTKISPKKTKYLSKITIKVKTSFYKNSAKFIKIIRKLKKEWSKL